MKIGILAHSLFPIAEPFAGGLEMQTHALVKGLMARGHDVTLFAAEGSDLAFNVVPFDLNVIEFEDVKHIARHDDFQDMFVNRHHAYLEVILNLEQYDFDIVHNNSLHYMPLTMAQSVPVPYVTALHTPPFVFLQSAAMAVKHKQKVNYVTVSDHTAEVWRNFITNHHTIHNGIDLSLWEYSPEADTDTVIWSGRMCIEKGPHLAIAAARKAGKRILLAGPMSSPEYYDTHVKPILGADAIYLGHLEQSQLARVVGNACCLLMTSTWEEPFGLVTVESLACGTPVAAFDSGATRHLLTPDTGRVVPKHDVAALAEAIAQCCHLDRAACRARAEAEFDQEVMVSRYEQFYRSVIAKEQVARTDVAVRPAVASPH